MKNQVVTISRQFGSGGREIGTKLAQALGVPCYDRSLIELAAREGKLDVEIVEQYDEKTVSPLFYSDPYQVSRMTPPISDTVFSAQSTVIRQLAERESCVIIGRCADAVLQDHSGCLRTFIFAPVKDRVERVIERAELPADKAREMVKTMDKKRRSYYNYFTDRRWGDVESYDLAINSSLLGVDGAVELIAAACRRLAERQ